MARGLFVHGSLLGAGFAAPLTCGGCAASPVAESVEEVRDAEVLPPEIAGHLFAMDAAEDAAARLSVYAPRWPLWSNGSEKARGVVLPPDADIDTSQMPWHFPPGTLFYKTFAYPVGPTGALRRLETRILRNRGHDWQYGVYLWNEDDDQGTLAESDKPHGIEVRVAGSAFVHEVPSLQQCRLCHENGETVVLGFNALQLGKTTLDAPDERTAWVQGYAVGNCIHCHNGSGRETSSFDMRPDVFLENTVDHPTESSAFGVGVRVVPGDPEASMLWLAVAGGDTERGAEPMPPYGVQRRDEEAIEAIGTWIRGLDQGGDQ